MENTLDINSPESRDVVGGAYFVWYYKTNVWTRTSWCGIQTLKSTMDMWSYQEIISGNKASLVVEFGAFKGGSAVFFAGVLSQLGYKSRVLTVDVADLNEELSKNLKPHSNIEFMHMSSTDPRVKIRIQELRKEYPGPMFVILDSDHTTEHVFDELTSIRDLTTKGDLVIVEDTNITTSPGENPGPLDALLRYEALHPDDYTHDLAQENKFGWTFAPHGFLIKK